MGSSVTFSLIILPDVRLEMDSKYVGFLANSHVLMC